MGSLPFEIKSCQMFLQISLSTDNGSETIEVSGNQRFIAAMEQIKQQIARENINFVRFEATDLHGVSRSKTVPVRFFHVINSIFLSDVNKEASLRCFSDSCRGLGRC